MEQNAIDLFAATHAEKLPAEKMPIIREALVKITDNQQLMINSVQYKDPTTMLIVSILLGSWGIDRFLLGEVGLGVLKLLTCGGVGIWTIVDWFTVREKTRQQNFQKLMQAIDPANAVAYMQ